MNWWPWQPKQVPARTAGSTAPTLHLGGAHHGDLLSSPIEDMTLLAARGNAAWRNAMNKAQAERQRKPEPAAIDWYRQRTRTAELRAEKFGMVLAEIVQIAGRRGPHNEIGALNQIEATAKGALKTQDPATTSKENKMVNGVTWDIKRFVRYTIVRTDRQGDAVSEKRIGEFESLDDAQLVSALLQDDEEADAK